MMVIVKLYLQAFLQKFENGKKKSKKNVFSVYSTFKNLLQNYSTDFLDFAHN